MWDHLDIAVVVGTEGDAGVYGELLSAECRGDGDDLRLAVVEQLAEVTRFFKLLTVDAPFLFQRRPVDLALVDCRVLHLFVGCLCIVGGRRLLRLFLVGRILLRLSGLNVRSLSLCLGFLLSLLRRRWDVNLVVLQHIGICHRVFCQIADNRTYGVVAVCRDTEESECRGVLALADKVRHEGFEGILAFGEFNEV